MDRATRDELAPIVRSGRAMLFTGAGFSSAARDVGGAPIPTTEAITDALWELSFPGERRDASGLQDLFHHAARHHTDELDRLLRQRLQVSVEHLPPWYAGWFAAPWGRIWTLNVDDLEQVAAARFRLPRPIRSLSALTTRFEDVDLERGDTLDVVHLNGSIEDGIGQITFSTPQYGDRLARVDPWYERFASDLVSHPFVFVGTRLDEAPFWRHLQAQTRGNGFGACKAIIITEHLTRARRALLEDVGIRWVPLTAEAFATELLEPLAESVSAR